MRRFLLLVLLLSGCAQLPPLPFMPASQLNSWQLNGRIAISTKNDNWTANVYWLQQESTYQLRLNTPLGQGALLLEGNDNGVVMHTADNRVFNAPNPDVLVTNVLKLEIPVTGLYFWIRGIPISDASYQWYNLNETGQLQNLRQKGWEIEYGRYINVQGTSLPRKIFLDNGQFRVKIAISQWNINLPTFSPKPLRVRL